MTDKRPVAVDDDTRRAAIMDAVGDPAALMRAVRDYYSDADRADRTEREVMYLHLGLLCGALSRVLVQLAPTPAEAMALLASDAPHPDARRLEATGMLPSDLAIPTPIAEPLDVEELDDLIGLLSSGSANDVAEWIPIIDKLTAQRNRIANGEK